MNSLSLYSTEQFLRSIPVESTRTYTAIPHGKVIDDIKRFTSKAGFTITRETYKQCNDGKIAQGDYTIHSVSDPDMCLQLSWQNSTNKQVSFKAAIGSFVFLCQNGCVFGDMGAFKKIHKGSADIEAYNLLEQIIGDAGESFQEMIKVKEALKEVELSKQFQAAFLGRLYAEKEILTITQMGIVKDEMDKPSFDYGVTDTAWNLYQHCTHSFKGITPRTYLPKQIELTRFFQEEIL